MAGCDSNVEKRALQKSHEKPQWLKWSETFFGKAMVDQQAYLVKLLKKITYDYLSECTPIILYDTFTELYDNLLLEKLLTNFPFAYIHGQITEEYKIKVKTTLNKKAQNSCVSYMLFMKDVMRSKDVIGEQNYNKVVVVARSSQWRVIEFLSDKESQNFVNLLVIVKSGQVVPQHEVNELCVTLNDIQSLLLGVAVYFVHTQTVRRCAGFEQTRGDNHVAQRELYTKCRPVPKENGLRLLGPQICCSCRSSTTIHNKQVYKYIYCMYFLKHN